jgi:hypothetical protein
MGLWFASALLPEGWRRNVRFELDGGFVVVKDARHVTRDAIAARYRAFISRLTA